MRNIALVFLASALAAGQNASVGNVQVGSFTGTARFGPVPRETVVTGKPYSYEQTFERTQVLTDGTRIVSRSVARKFRDSLGRTRSEPAESRGMIDILDPVAGFHFMIYGGIAHRGPVMPIRSGPVGSFPAAQPKELVPEAQTDYRPPPGPEVLMESLGTKEIDGILAEGRRDTQTYPVGSIGNDREIVVIDEMWRSPDFRITLRESRHDPRSGDITIWVQNLSRTEPDAALFRPPGGVEIVDDNWPVVIHFPSPMVLNEDAAR